MMVQMYGKCYCYIIEFIILIKIAECKRTNIQFKRDAKRVSWPSRTKAASNRTLISKRNGLSLHVDLPGRLQEQTYRDKRYTMKMSTFLRWLTRGNNNERQR